MVGSKAMLRGMTEFQPNDDRHLCFFRAQMSPQLCDSGKCKEDVCLILTSSFKEPEGFSMLSGRQEQAATEVVLTLDFKKSHSNVGSACHLLG